MSPIIKGIEASRGKESSDLGCRLPGGGIEFCESSSDALMREINEELNAFITGKKLLTVMENLFEISGIKAHEICFLYEISVQSDFYDKISYTITETSSKANAIWIDKDTIMSGKIKVYPEALINYL